MLNRHAVVATGLLAVVVPLTSFSFQAPRPNKRDVTPHAVKIHRPDVQQRLSVESAPWKMFQARFGRALQVVWDERTGVPSRIYGAPIPLVGQLDTRASVIEAAQNFVDGELLALIGPLPGLALASANQANGTWYLRWARTANGLPIEGASIELRIQKGRIVLLKLAPHLGADAAALVEPRVSSSSAQRLAVQWLGDAAKPSIVNAPTGVVIAVADKAGYAYHRAWTLTVRDDAAPALWQVAIDAAGGSVLKAENQYRYVSGAVAGNVEPRTVGDPLTEMALPFLTVNVSGQKVSADHLGQFQISPGPATAQLSGTYTQVLNDAGPDAQAQFEVSATNADFVFTEQIATQAEIDAYRHTETVKEWARGLVPDVAWLDTLLSVHVNVNGECNAYWDGQSTNFFSEGASCNNTARIADVVYHEFGHGLHQHLTVAGVLDGTIGEGSGDYVAAAITGDPHLGPGFLKQGGGDGSIRSADNKKRYPQDVSGEVHDDGEIWSGAMWDLRQVLQAKYGSSAGGRATDLLFLNVLRSGPQLDNVYSEVLLANDDDGDLSNGTPDQCEIDEVFFNRGLADNVSSRLQLVHTQVLDPVAAMSAVALHVSVPEGSACFAGQPDSIVVHWSIDGKKFTDASLVAGGTGEYDYEIPAQPEGTVVSYYFTAQKDDVRAQVPNGSPRSLYAFYVGMTEPVWFDDFEQDLGWTHGLSKGDSNTQGADDWQRGTPQGLSGDPFKAFSGENIWGNDLGNDGWNGAYQPNVATWLQSPEIDCTGCEGARLQFRRWLQVEDGQFDTARILVNGEEVWRNGETTGGTDHHRDFHWAFYDIDISKIADGKPVVVRYEIASDEGLSMGGWNIDDVAVVVPRAATIAAEGDDDGGAFGCACSVSPRQGLYRSSGVALLLLVSLFVLRRRSFKAQGRGE